MMDIFDIGYTEFYDVGDKVCLGNGQKFGVVVKTYDLDEDNRIIGGDLIICWDTEVECDYEICSGDKENYLFRIESDFEFTYINDDGTFKS